MQYSIDITTEQSFRYIELTDAKIWISKNASLCRVLANRVTISDRNSMYNDLFTCYFVLLSAGEYILSQHNKEKQDDFSEGDK